MYCGICIVLCGIKSRARVRDHIHTHIYLKFKKLKQTLYSVFLQTFQAQIDQLSTNSHGLFRLLKIQVSVSLDY